MTGADDRGQLLLITAILIALVIIGSVVLLNGIQFSRYTGGENTLRSVESADQTREELRLNAERVFTGLDNNTTATVRGTTVPFVPNGSTDASAKLAAAYTEYNRTYADLTVRSSTGLTTLALNTSRTRNGTLVRNDSGRPFDPGTNITNINGSVSGAVVPYLHVNVTSRDVSSGPFTVNFTSNKSGRSYKMRFGSNVTVAYDGSTRNVSSDPIDADNWTSLTVTHGTGVVETRNPNVTCGGFTLPDFEGNVTVSLDNATAANGTFLATVGTGANASNSSSGPLKTVANGIIDPAVDMQYESPTVSYNGTIQIMGENV